MSRFRFFSTVQDSFRTAYTQSKSSVVRWFPGHMQKGLLQIQAKLRSIDCIIEIHDARIPFSGRNLRFRDLISLRPHILLLNKSDLSNLDRQSKVKVSEKLQSYGVDTVFYTNLRATDKSKFLSDEILPAVKTLTESRPRYNREGVDTYNILVIGVPNVGKSTFINALRKSKLHRKGKATTVGAVAGVTRSVLSRIKVSVSPPVYIYDTPGILPPRIKDLETGMRLASCACVPDHLVGEVNIADYILFWLNSREHFYYVEHFNLDHAADNVIDVLAKIALNNRKVTKVKNVATNKYIFRPDFNEAAKIFIASFRSGDLGKYILDDDYLNNNRDLP